MKQLDFDRAFPQTPDCVRAAIEMGFRKGQKKMKIQHKIIGLSSVAAALAVIAAVAALAMGGISGAPMPDILAQPRVTDSPKITEEASVYCTENGTYYHLDEFCSGMRTATQHSLSEASSMGKKPCPVCVPSSGEPITFIYYSQGSPCFHKDQVCGGESYPLKAEAANAFSSSTWENPGKAPCPDCLPHGISVILGEAYIPLGDTVSEAALQAAADQTSPDERPSVFCTEDGEYYHADENCMDMRDGRRRSLLEAQEMGKTPCPRCMGLDVVFGTPKGNYYHSEKDCSGMENPSAMSMDEALWWNLTPCPTCILEKKVHVASCDFYYHAGENCSAAEFFYDMYPLLDALGIGMTPCPECTAVEISEEEKNMDPFWADKTYYYTEKGVYLHDYETCLDIPGMLPCFEEEGAAQDRWNCPICLIGTERAYATERGVYFHFDPECSGMENADEITTWEAVERAQGACPVCVIPYVYDVEAGARTPTEADRARGLAYPELGLYYGDWIYTTHDGNFFHRRFDCSGMEDADRMRVEEAMRSGKTPCPVCVDRDSHQPADEAFGFGETDYSIDKIRAALLEKGIENDPSQPQFYFTLSGRYYHRDEHCSGMMAASPWMEAAAVALDKLPCPVCVTSDAAALSSPASASSPQNDGSESMDFSAPSATPLPLNSDEQNFFAEEPLVYLTENGVYQHYDSNCCGISGAQPYTHADALPFRRMYCPVCGLSQEMVYYTQRGRYFHIVEDCSGMRGAALHTASQAPWNMKEACPVCVVPYVRDIEMDQKIPSLDYLQRFIPYPHRNGLMLSDLVYSELGDDYFHLNTACPRYGDGEQVLLQDALGRNQGSCPQCVLSPVNCTLFETAFGQFLSDLRKGYSFDRVDLVDLDGTRSWVLSNGTEEYSACVLYDWSRQSESTTYELHVMLPFEADSRRFMEAVGVEPVGHMYPRALEAADQYFRDVLGEKTAAPAWVGDIIVLFDGNGQVIACIMRCSQANESCVVTFKQTDSGEFGMHVKADNGVG